MNGFYTSLAIYCIFCFSDNKLKILYFILTPILILGLFSSFTTENIPWMITCFLLNLSGAILAHINEYTARKAFSLNIIIKE